MKLEERCLEDPLPVVPIVLGGDDMTVVMDGRFAIQFTIDFLSKFEELTGADLTVTGITKDKVTTCAGVAVVKRRIRHRNSATGGRIRWMGRTSARRCARSPPMWKKART